MICYKQVGLIPKCMFGLTLEINQCNTSHFQNKEIK